jgi:chaperonin GroEL (HSP60 family)
VINSDTRNAEELDWPYDTNFFQEPTSGSALIASGDSRKAVIRGARIVCDALATAYGPEGEGVAVSKQFGRSIPLRRGAQIVQGIKSASYLEGKGIEEIRSVSVDIDGSVGDGSKLAALLASEFMTKGPHSLGVRAEQHLSR